MDKPWFLCSVDFLCGRFGVDQLAHDSTDLVHLVAIAFVAHGSSLPAIGEADLAAEDFKAVARHALTTDLAERTGKLVMLAPPNTGSDIIEWAGESLPVRLLLGPAGCALTVNNCVDKVPFAREAPGDVRGCAIMGDLPLIPGTQWLLPGANDGIVTVEGGRLPWLEEFHVVPGDHTYIMQREDVQSLILDFLKKP